MTVSERMMRGTTRGAKAREVMAGIVANLPPVALRTSRALRACLAGAVLLSATGCETVKSITDPVLAPSKPPAGTVGSITGFLGAVVADEPRAAVAAREILSAGGSAGDAAVALAFALSVTLPSRVGLGASGACLAYAPGRNTINGGAPEAIMFTAVPAAPGGARPASVPMLARGMFALHARYGRRPMEMGLSSAEQLARFGTPASRAMA